jgi:allophanate hydrolase
VTLTEPVSPGTPRDALAAARATNQPAFISLLDEARVQALTDAAPPGTLHGVAFAVKDNIDVAGVPTTAACPALTTPARRSAFAVQRLLDAGAVPIGKTNMDQFATGLVGTRTPYGACRSVDSQQHISGGSSSGSAIAVASGVVALALGTDTAGSGRVPAAFNGLVGLKPTRGLVSTRGVLPACPSLDCVSTFTRRVAVARAVFDVLACLDAEDPYGRAMPAIPPPGVARQMRVVGVPSGTLDLDPEHLAAWQATVAVLGAIVTLVPVDVTPMLATAPLLYEPPFVAERLQAFGHLLEPDGPHLDPVVRRVVRGAMGASAHAVFGASRRLAELRHSVVPTYLAVDAVLLPVTPGHPTAADVAADPVGVNARLGTYTNMANLLDLCAIALPMARRADGLPFGVQLLAPAFADRPLLDLAARVLGERADPVPVAPNRGLLVVCGAHLLGQPLNGTLLEAGARLFARARTAGGYRMYRIRGPLPRPGLVLTGDGPAGGLEVELWDVPHEGLGQLLSTVTPPLRLGQVRLDDGTAVPGFLTDRIDDGTAEDITASGGWRSYLAGR